jgi:hypothetical protein
MDAERLGIAGRLARTFLHSKLTPLPRSCSAHSQ